MVEAVVEFDYVAQESDELSLRKGDVITNIITQPGGWWEGTLSGKRGMFPDNFVKVLSEADGTKDSNCVTLRSSSGRRCKVLFSYQPANEDELELEVDDVIDILAEVEEGWWKGRLGDTIGVFPSNFVTEIVDTQTASVRKPRTSSREEASESDGEISTSVSSPDSSQVLDSVGKPEQDSEAPVLPPKPVKEVCRVLFPYEAANEDELTLKEGDLIMLLSREVADKGWWKGELRGKVGVFPDNFVEVVQQEEQQQKKPDRPPAKSQIMTTNRARDSITKPVVTVPTAAKMKGDPATHCGASDTLLKADERPSSAGSAVSVLPGKKLSLPPPPIKKVQRVTPSSFISAPLTKRDSAAELRLTPDAVDGAGPSRPAQKPSPQGLLEFDSVERSAMLTHPTATRVKAPRRRPPTTVYNKEADSQNSGLMNGSAETGHVSLDNHIVEEEEEGGVERSRGLAWDKRKVPWVEELKLNQARKTSGLSSTALGQSPPEQAEKKLPKSKLDSSPDYKQTPTSVMLRSHPSRPQSVFHDSLSRTSPQTRPLSAASPPDPARLMAEVSQTRSKPLSGSSTSPVLVTLQTRQETVSPSARPANSTSSSTSPVQASVMVKHTADSTSPSSMSDPDILASPTPRSPGLASGSSVTYKQFSELKDKVSKLEQALEAQQEMFTKALSDLNTKLKEETERRVQLQQAVDKLTNLVTQV